MHRAIAERAFHHPIDKVFARYTDHARWGDWSGFGRVRLVREGSPDRNGVGAVRAFSVAPGLHEEVTLFEPPCRMEYRIARGGFPVVNHRGVVSFEPDDAITRVRWEVTFDSRIPGTGGFIARAITRLFRKVLERLDRSLR